jgi:hypothetical protein
MDIKTPECDRMIAARSDTQPVGEFIEWAREQGLVLCRFGEHARYWPDGRSVEQLLAEWQHIDLTEVERERRAILAGLSSKPDFCNECGDPE